VPAWARARRVLLSNAWYKKVCNRTLTLRQAQKLELGYKRKFG